MPGRKGFKPTQADTEIEQQLRLNARNKLRYTELCGGVANSILDCPACNRPLGLRETDDVAGVRYHLLCAVKIRQRRDVAKLERAAAKMRSFDSASIEDERPPLLVPELSSMPEPTAAEMAIAAELEAELLYDQVASDTDATDPPTHAPSCAADPPTEEEPMTKDPVRTRVHTHDGTAMLGGMTLHERHTEGDFRDPCCTQCQAEVQARLAPAPIPVVVDADVPPGHAYLIDPGMIRPGIPPEIQEQFDSAVERLDPTDQGVIARLVEEGTMDDERRAKLARITGLE